LYAPEEVYIKNPGEIYSKASRALALGGSIAWVTTTQQSLSQNPDCGITGVEFNSCIDMHNGAALKLLKGKSDVAVANLNAAVNRVCGKDHGDCNLQRWRNTHLTIACKAVSSERWRSPRWLHHSWHPNGKLFPWNLRFHTADSRSSLKL
jgi:hypothetical protein